MKKYSLAINRCPEHKEFWSVSVDDENGGTRITGSKCCGRWDVIKTFQMRARDWREAVIVFESAAEEMEQEP